MFRRFVGVRGVFWVARRIHRPFTHWRSRMSVVVLVSSLLAVSLALAFARETRLRRALQRLLAKILSR